MVTQDFKERIYEVEIKSDFVLKPSIVIQNQVQVTNLNWIYDLTAKARTLKYLNEFLFLIANVFIFPARFLMYLLSQQAFMGLHP